MNNSKRVAGDQSPGKPARNRRAASVALWSGSLLLLASCLYQSRDIPPPVDGVEVSLNEDNFQSEVLQSPQLVLVEFGATWCGPCRDMESVLAHLSLDYEGRVKVGKVDVDESERLAAEYEASGIPLMVLIKDGVEVDRTVGWHSLDELSNWVDGYL